MALLYQKAVIQIENNTVEEVQEQETKSSLSLAKGLSGFSQITDKLKNAAVHMMGDNLKQTVSQIMGAETDEIDSFSVQFNPAEIQIHVGGKESRPRTGADRTKKRVSYGILGVRKEVTFSLYFDGDKTEMNKVEKLLKANKSPYSRNIKFSWGNQLYQGILSDMSVQYTMFSSKGEPIQAKVELTILCGGRDES